MYCSKCGHELKDGEVYCPNCGFKQFNNETQELISTNQVASNPDYPILNSNSSVRDFDSNLKSRSKVNAILLALFLGSMGVHNFYLGRTKYAFGQLALWICYFILNIIFSSLLNFGIINSKFFTIVRIIISCLIIASGIWALVDLILICLDKINPGKGYKINQK